MIRTGLRWAATLWLLFVFGAASASAQPRVATLVGFVSTPDGARLPRASIMLTDRTSGRRSHGTTDDLGAFLFDRLPAGTYEVVVEFPGLTTKQVSGVVVSDGTTRLEIILEPAHVQEFVTVSSAVPRDSVEVTAVRESAARDVGELLSAETGLWKLRKGGIANDVVLRGLQSRDLNVLIDGERLYGACPNHMDPPAFHVDFSQVERVDVGKGPFDVRYQGSLGGIVNVVTRRPDAGWHGTAAITGGSYGFVNPSATLSYGTSRVSFLGGASYRRSAPYANGRGLLMTANAGYRDSEVESDAFRATTLWGRMAWRSTSGHQLEASYTRQRTDHVLYPYLQMDALWDNADRGSIEYQAPDGRLQGLKVQGYLSAVDHWMTDALRTSSLTAARPYSMGTDATTFTGGGRVEARVRGVLIGTELFRRNWNTETMLGMVGAYARQSSIPDVNIDSVGVFAEHTRPVGSRMALDLGGRLDRIASSADRATANLALYRAYHATDATSRSDVLPAGRARVTIQLARSVDVAAAVGHTARVAEGNERFFGLQRMGSDWVGNPTLAPTRNTGLDVSVTVRRARATVTANAYVNDMRNYVAVYQARRLAMVPGVMNALARSFGSVDARQRGLETSGSLTLRTAWTVSGDLSYVRGTMTPRADAGLTSTNLAEMPPMRGRLRTRVDNGRLFGELEGVASARQDHVDISLGETPTASYAIANLTGGIRLRQLTVTAGVANLFDQIG
ncbi:MAG: TonB-dependent receptor, partial [Vicinamibacterales bacterium]